MGNIPEITDEEVDAAHTVMVTIKKLHQYAEQHPDDSLSAERLELLFNYVQGFHSTLSMIYVAQNPSATEAEGDDALPL